MTWLDLATASTRLETLVGDIAKGLMRTDGVGLGEELRLRVGDVQRHLAGRSAEELGAFDANFPGLRASLPDLLEQADTLKREGVAASLASQTPIARRPLR